MDLKRFHAIAADMKKKTQATKTAAKKLAASFKKLTPPISMDMAVKWTSNTPVLDMKAIEAAVTAALKKDGLSGSALKTKLEAFKKDFDKSIQPDFAKWATLMQDELSTWAAAEKEFDSAEEDLRETYRTSVKALRKIREAAAP